MRRSKPGQALAGLTLIEMMVTGIVILVLLGGLLQAFITIWSANSFSMYQVTAQQDAKQMAMSVADSIRHATICTSSDSGCTVGTAVESASTSGLTTYYRDTNNTYGYGAGSLVKIQYAASGSAYQITVGTGSAETVVPSTSSSGASLTLTYYKCDGTYTSYHANTLASYTPSSTADYKALIAVDIVAQVTEGSVTARYETMARLRNSPTTSSLN